MTGAIPEDMAVSGFGFSIKAFTKTINKKTRLPTKSMVYFKKRYSRWGKSPAPISAKNMQESKVTGLRIALCDDEIKTLKEISACIKSYSAQDGKTELEVFPFNSAKSLLDAIRAEKDFDIFLLDIYIGDETGTALARALRANGIDKPIIFLTTSVDHAPESFEYDTLRYLIKPLKTEKLYEALDAAVEKSKKIGNKFIRLKTMNGIENINTSNILYTESRSHYQYVNFLKGEQARSRMTVTELYGILSQFGCFVRCGSSYIINLNKIKSISTTEVCFNNDLRLPLPRGTHNALKEAFWLLQYNEQED